LSSAAGVTGEGGPAPHGGQDALLQQAIGAAVLERLAGQNEPPSRTYRRKGGADQATFVILAELDAIWPTMEELLAEGLEHIEKAEGGKFGDLYKKLSGGELALVERTIGQSFLERAAGKKSDLLDMYQALGGDNPTSIKIFAQFREPFAGFDPKVPVEA